MDNRRWLELGIRIFGLDCAYGGAKVLALAAMAWTGDYYSRIHTPRGLCFYAAFRIALGGYLARYPEAAAALCLRRSRREGGASDPGDYARLLEIGLRCLGVYAAITCLQYCASVFNAGTGDYFPWDCTPRGLAIQAALHGLIAAALIFESGPLVRWLVRRSPPPVGAPAPAEPPDGHRDPGVY